MISKNVVFWIILVSLTLLCVEALSLVALFILENRHASALTNEISPEHRAILETFLTEEPKYTKFSSELGWTVKSGGKLLFEPENRAPYEYRSNNQSIRADREFYPDHPKGLIRIVTLGDSFTHGDDVGNEDTWQSYIEKQDDRFQVLNFGVSGYGLDQAYLRYQKDAAKYNGSIVFIGFMPINIYRNVNVYRPFYSPITGIPLTKPRFRLGVGGLNLVPNPTKSKEGYRALLENPQLALSRFGVNDFFFQKHHNNGPFNMVASARLLKRFLNAARLRIIGDGVMIGGVYNSSSEAFKLTLKIFDEFYEAVIRNGSKPIIVILPARSDIQSYINGEDQRYKPLLSALKSRQYLHIDMLDILVGHLGSKYELEDLFNGHYSPLANSLVATALVSYINNHGLVRETPN